jgi:hypothetical protein
MRTGPTVLLPEKWEKAWHPLLPGSPFGRKLKLKKGIPIHNINTKKLL